MTFGISGGGADAESQFIALTGATPAARRADGDALIEGHLVEVKSASSFTLNQVRATKYITLVAFEVGTGDWYVVPAHEIVRGVSRKQRGQHTENPFESATLSLRNLTAFRLTDPSVLRTAVLNAVASSEKYPRLREEMRRVRTESRRSADDALVRVRALLRQQ